MSEEFESEGEGMSGAFWSLLETTSEELAKAFPALPNAGSEIPDVEAMKVILDEVAHRLGDNFPYHHPLYAGQMLKPPHPIARLAYALSMEINPNNHARDGGRASSVMELQVMQALADMFGFEKHLGHLTSGGTMANLEALWVARELANGRRRVLASREAHYTHHRMSQLLGLDFVGIDVDAYGRMDLASLTDNLADDVACVVVTLGTTSRGALDPLEEVLPLARKYGARIHVDAAYGGYFSLVSDDFDELSAAYRRIHECDSVCIDPHKHGLQPYGSGAILYADPSVGRIYKHDSPYTYFTSDQLHLGEISLECSRPGAAAVANWATLQLLPLVQGGEFARQLKNSLAAARALYAWVQTFPVFVSLSPPSLDIVVFGVRETTASAASHRAREIFENAAQLNLHLALLKLPVSTVKPWWPDLQPDEAEVTVLRSCLMKPEHLKWIDQITRLLEQAAAYSN